jgi:probable F420-dependent oxidoreductase
MKVGVVQIFDGTPGRGIDHVIEFAQHVEALGFDSLWVPDHVIFFDNYGSKYPHTDDGSIDFKKDQGILEPSMTMLAAGLNTKRIRVGTSVEILTERNPVIRARELATVDVAIGGRIEYGIGVGWSQEEYAALGIPFDERGARCDEYIESMRVLWSEKRPTYHGRFVDFDSVIFNPKPPNGKIPIVIGGNSPAALTRVAKLGDGWHGWKLTLDEVAEKLAEIDVKLQKYGRRRDELKLNVGLPFKGDLDDLVAYRDGLIRLGIDEMVFAMGFSRARFKEQLSEVASKLKI